MKSLLFTSVLIIFLSLTGLVSAVSKSPASLVSQSSDEIPAPPDVSGVYDVPERPGMKVKVFAHPLPPEKPKAPARNASPTPSVAVSNLLVCSADPQSNSVIGKAGWKIPNGNITYLLNTSSVPSTVGSANLAGIVKLGFDQYKSAASNNVNFVQGSNTSVSRARYDGRNIISWGSTSSGTLGVTYVWYYTQTGLTAEIDTIMNNKYKWTWSKSNLCADNLTYDAQNIMTHELGHWLGLNDEYDASLFGDNTMFGYGSKGESKKNTLTAGDISGVSAIYPP